MKVIATPETVLAKLMQLHIVHERLGDANRSFGVDTLCMLFSTGFDDMIEILETLAKDDKVCLVARTMGGKQTGKNRVVYVNLLQ